MGSISGEIIQISSENDEQLAKTLKSHAMSLTVDEARKVHELLGRDPSLTELHIFNIQWSEHSSYKSSRSVLKQLPTDAPHVILGPVEDSGVVKLGEHNGDTYGVVVSHESHNHPSQVVPYEGAATGVGGIIRDVCCMGSQVFATADLLRFGNPKGAKANKVKYIAHEVINGVAGYGNAVGIPNIAGDVYSNDSFDDNCLVNVVCLGILKEQDIIHSYAPKDAEGYDIVLVGKATDNSGFGGAAFSSMVLDEDEQESNRGAVQVPDPFLKNILLRATMAVFKESRAQGITLGFKDLGAGGIMCGSTELCSDSGFGATINLDNVNTAFDDLPGYVVAASETQERFIWISPKTFTPKILSIYNEDFELERVSHGAKATVIGEVTKDTEYKVTHKGEVVCHAPIESITKGIRHDRPQEENKRTFNEPNLSEPTDYAQELLSVLSHPNVASKMSVYKHYDTNVMGNTIIHSGEADAGLMAPVQGSKLGVALKADGNPRFGKIDPYWGGVHAVAESMRNVAAIGAVPTALTDCLNYGNPEDPKQFYDFVQGVKGIADAANKLHYKGSDHCVPIVSGNVSFYNHSASGNSVDPSPVVACVGVMQDYSKAVTMKLTRSDSVLLLIGERKDECGGSVYYDVHDEVGSHLPHLDFDEQKKQMHAVIDAINDELILSCHDISDGGLGAAVSEMILGGDADGNIGVSLDVSEQTLPLSQVLFCETPGYVIEVDKEKETHVLEFFVKNGVEVTPLGKTTKESALTITNKDNIVMKLSIDELRKSWTNGFTEAFE